MGKEICNLTFTREADAANQNWGFRIIGGTDQGQTYKVSHSGTFGPNSFQITYSIWNPRVALVSKEKKLHGQFEWDARLYKAEKTAKIYKINFSEVFFNFVRLWLNINHTDSLAILLLFRTFPLLE